MIEAQIESISENGEDVDDCEKHIGDKNRWSIRTGAGLTEFILYSNTQYT